MVIMLMGPTGTGKTQLALELAASLPLEIISVDSALVYQDMNIGTAKPAKAVLAQTPHHLVDIISPEKNYSAAEFLVAANQAIQRVEAKGKIPLLVGGTMLYFKAFLEGLAEIPAVPQEIRAKLQSQAISEGLASLYAKLSEIDPLTAQRLHANDAQRILRALEVYQASGKPLSYWLESAKQTKPTQPSLQLSLVPEDRSVLHTVLAQRFQAMLAEGFIDEVKALQAKYQLTAETSSMRCVGYRQIWQYLAGQINYTTMCETSIAASRQLAKRQLTWLRSWPQHQQFAAYEIETLTKIKKYY